MSFKPWGTEGAKKEIQNFYTQLRGFLAKRAFERIRDLYPDDTVIFAGKSGKCHKGKHGAFTFWEGRFNAGDKVKSEKIQGVKAKPVKIQGVKVKSVKIQIIHVKEVEAIVRVGDVFKKQIEKVFYLGKVTHNSPDVEEWFSGIADHGEECCINGIYETHNY